MGGILRGSIEHVLSTSSQGMSRDMFAAVVNFFDNHPQMTRIASQAGSTGLVGDAATALPGYTGSANYSGENAFGVWRWDKTNGSKIYILCQWGYNSGIGVAPGNPGVSAQNGGIGFQFAMDTSGGNPWNGGTANAGADTKNATNVWVANGGTLLVWPRANGPGGTGATVRQYMSGVFYTGVTGTRLHLMMDDDAFWYAADYGSNGGYDNIGYFGPYIPHAGITLSSPNAALVHLHFSGLDNAEPNQTTQIGTTAGNTAYEGGAVVQPADGVRGLKVSWVPQLNNALHSPNPYTGSYDEHDIYLRMEDAVAPSKNGLFGKIDPAMLAVVTQIGSNNTNVGKTRVVLGSVTLAHYKLLFKWDGVTTPTSGGTNTGIQF